MKILERLSCFRNRLCERHTSQAIPSDEENHSKWGLRDALLRCETLTEAEIDEYMAYHDSEYSELVPLDYELTHPGERVSCLYSDAIVQVKSVRRHRVQISKETLEKVQRVLPLIYLPSSSVEMF